MSWGSGARRRGTGVALLAAAGMAVAGCGGSSKNGGATGGGKGDPVVATTASGAQAKTVSFDADAVADGTTQKMSGVIDFATTVKADVTVKITGSADPQAPSQMHLLVYGATHFMSADSFQNSGAKVVKALNGKHWVRMQSGAAAGGHQDTAAAAFGAVSLQSDPDLTKALAALTDSGLVKPDGAGHYSGTVEAAALDGSQLDAFHRAALREAMKAVSVTSEKIEVWLGADGHPTEIKFTDQVAAGKKPSSGDVRFSGWGKPVTMTVPADADTIGFDALTKALQAG